MEQGNDPRDAAQRVNTFGAGDPDNKLFVHQIGLKTGASTCPLGLPCRSSSSPIKMDQLPSRTQ
eukprot:1496204-Alexandrium_andersonii.AAC.1